MAVPVEAVPCDERRRDVMLVLSTSALRTASAALSSFRCGVAPVLSTEASHVSQAGSVVISCRAPEIAMCMILPPTHPKWSPTMRTYLESVRRCQWCQDLAGCPRIQPQDAAWLIQADLCQSSASQLCLPAMGIANQERVDLHTERLKTQLIFKALTSRLSVW